MKLRDMKSRNLICLLGLGLTACSASDTSLNNFRIQSDLDNDGAQEKIMGVYVFNTPKFDYELYVSTDKIDTSIDRPIRIFSYTPSGQEVDLKSIIFEDLNKDRNPELVFSKTDGSTYYMPNLGNLKFSETPIKLSEADKQS
jgi:hypothetical protein